MTIIDSLLDTDIYKLTMQQSALHQFNTSSVEYRFKCRNRAQWNQKLLSEINKEIDHYCTLRFNEEELNYLSSLSYFKADYIDFLRLYKANRDHISLWLDDQNELQLMIKGPWYLTILFEVPLLAIINEVYFSGFEVDKNKGMAILNKKKDYAREKGFPFVDFGTRRRFSRTWHDRMIQTLIDLPNFMGTSNVQLAMKYGLNPIGTMAHEYIMAGAGQDDISLRKSQADQLQKWAEEYRGDLGLALTDTYGFDAFLNDFDLYFAKLYDGLRHDSGDPMVWAEKALSHYRKLGIDPHQKKLVFSDGLTMERANEIYEAYKDQAMISFGIGTHLTNDFPHITPLQIVIKLVSCNGKPVVKLSDSPGKEMSPDNSYTEYIKQVFKI